MKIELWYIGKTSFAYLKEGEDLYEKRIKRYLPFQKHTIPDIKNAKNMGAVQLKEKEGNVVLDKLKSDDCLILLDENGKHYTSVEFSSLLESKMQSSHKRLIFLIGGAFGFSDTVYRRANFKISLSKMTFSHQMIRIFALEQFYRALTIMKNEPYHNN
jgi:23S rRNA (pseudouridine1915-N3)-methyltransferase